MFGIAIIHVFRHHDINVQGIYLPNVWNYGQFHLSKIAEAEVKIEFLNKSSKKYTPKGNVPVKNL